MHRPSLRSILRSPVRSFTGRSPGRLGQRVPGLASSLRERWTGAGRKARAVWAAGGLSALAVGAVVVAVTTIAAGSPGPGHRHRPVPVVADPDPGQRPQAAFAASAPPAPVLPAAAAPPAPPPPAVAASPAVRPHELFGFAPYWTLDRQASFDVGHLTTVAYFGLEIGKDATTLEMERLRVRRIIEALEQTASPESGELLRLLAEGAAEEDLRDMARGAFERLGKRQ